MARHWLVLESLFFVLLPVVLATGIDPEPSRTTRIVFGCLVAIPSCLFVLNKTLRGTGRLSASLDESGTRWHFSVGERTVARVKAAAIVATEIRCRLVSLTGIGRKQMAAYDIWVVTENASALLRSDVPLREARQTIKGLPNGNPIIQRAFAAV